MKRESHLNGTLVTITHGLIVIVRGPEQLPCHLLDRCGHVGIGSRQNGFLALEPPNCHACLCISSGNFVDLIRGPTRGLTL